jgi:hypothetical protein
MEAADQDYTCAEEFARLNGLANGVFRGTGGKERDTLRKAAPHRNRTHLPAVSFLLVGEDGRAVPNMGARCLNLDARKTGNARGQLIHRGRGLPEHVPFPVGEFDGRPSRPRFNRGCGCGR